jgi:hypothetical protein
VPIRTALAGFIGIGVAIAGGNENAISGNRVTHSERYGIAVFPTARFVVFAPGAHEPGPPWRPRRNRIAGNLVTGSGRTDLALWPRGPGPATASPRTPSGGRCRPASRHRPARADPQRATRRSPRCSPAPSASWSTRRRGHPPSYTSMPVPRQPSMPASG